MRMGSRGSPERDGGGCPTHAERMASRGWLLRAGQRHPPGRHFAARPLAGWWPGRAAAGSPSTCAAGLVDHLDYRRDLWRRLLRTLRALYLIVYGSKAEADRAAETVQAVHAFVRGTTRARLGPSAQRASASLTSPSSRRSSGGSGEERPHERRLPHGAEAVAVARSR